MASCDFFKQQKTLFLPSPLFFAPDRQTCFSRIFTLFGLQRQDARHYFFTMCTIICCIRRLNTGGHVHRGISTMSIYSNINNVYIYIYYLPLPSLLCYFMVRQLVTITCTKRSCLTCCVKLLPQSLCSKILLSWIMLK